MIWSSAPVIKPTTTTSNVLKRQYYEVPPQYARGSRLFHRDRLHLRSMVFWASFFLGMLCLAFPPFRYLAYAVPVLTLLACLADAQVTVEDEVKPFLVIIAAGLLLGPLAIGEGWKDLFFIFAGMSVALLPSIPRLSLGLIFFWLVVGFAYLYGVWGDFSGGLRFDFMESLSSFEGNFSFVFAVLVPFSVAARRYVLAAACFVLAVLTLKRIAIVAAVVATLFVLLGPKRGRLLLNPPVMLAVNACVLALNMLYTFGDLDWFIKYFTGQSANQFGMGRQSLQWYVVDGLVNSPWQSLLGHGMGAVYEAAQRGFGAYEKVNLHSDLMKLAYEIGYVFTAVTIWFMYSSRHYMLRVGFLFVNVMFFTDNTLIYFFFTFFFFLIMRMQREGLLDPEPTDGVAGEAT